MIFYDPFYRKNSLLTSHDSSLEKCKQKMHVVGPLSRLLKELADTKQTGPEEAVSVSIDE